MKERLIHMVYRMNKVSGLYLLISSFIFFFVYFFHPYSSRYIDYHQPLLLAFVIGVIVFLTMLFVRDIYPCLMNKDVLLKEKSIGSIILSSFAIWFISSLACIFYIGYMESEGVSGDLLFKVALICLFPSLILMVYDKLEVQKHKIELLTIQTKEFQNTIHKKSLSRKIHFQSKNGLESFSLTSKEILFIKSADNYIEIHYIDGEHHQKKLLRNTLRNIETQVKPFSNLMRCHRTSIVNTNHIEKFNHNCYPKNLSLKGFDRTIPVSRQYVKRIKTVKV